MNRKVLITGSSGMLGKDLSKVFKLNGDYVIGLDINESIGAEIDKHYQIDLCERSTTLKILEFEKPDIIIYAAAIVNLDFCEENKKLADCVHVSSPELIANNKENKAQFIYISTDSVFDGLRGNYTEEDITNPLNYYSLSKQIGEEAVLQTDNCLVVRTNIFGFNIPLKQSLAEWAIGNLQAGKKITGFDDVMFNPIYTYDLATLIEQVTKYDITGIINIASKGLWSKFEFIKCLALNLGYRNELVEKGNSKDFKFKINRPLKTNLNTKKIETVFNIPTLEDSLNNFCLNIKKHKYEIW